MEVTLPLMALLSVVVMTTANTEVMNNGDVIVLQYPVDSFIMSCEVKSSQIRHECETSPPCDLWCFPDLCRARNDTTPLCFPQLHRKRDSERLWENMYCVEMSEETGVYKSVIRVFSYFVGINGKPIGRKVTETNTRMEVHFFKPGDPDYNIRRHGNWSELVRMHLTVAPFTCNDTGLYKCLDGDANTHAPNFVLTTRLMAYGKIYIEDREVANDDIAQTVNIKPGFSQSLMCSWALSYHEYKTTILKQCKDQPHPVNFDDSGHKWFEYHRTIRKNRLVDLPTGGVCNLLSINDTVVFAMLPELEGCNITCQLFIVQRNHTFTFVSERRLTLQYDLSPHMFHGLPINASSCSETFLLIILIVGCVITVLNLVVAASIYFSKFAEAKKQKRLKKGALKYFDSRDFLHRDIKKDL